MKPESTSYSYRGKHKIARSITLTPHLSVMIDGAFIRIGNIFDEFWIRSKEILPLPEIVNFLQTHPTRPDIFTSAQKLPNISPIYSYYYEWDNLAVIEINSYSEWFANQIDRSARKQLRQSSRTGIRTEITPFNNELIAGICSIYNETPIRQGKRFWHYGKDQETVRIENGTYLERSIFIGAFYNHELVGFAKIVFDDEISSLMQIVSKISFFGKRPNNALLSKAVEVCEKRQSRYLTYGCYIYGKNERSSLVDFKKSLGFKRVNIPRYFIPLTFRGRLALKIGAHKGILDLIPNSLSSKLTAARAKYYKFLR